MHPGILRRNQVTVAGSGARTLIFGHGFGCDQTAWRFVQPDFARDHRTVTFDYVGAGHSDLAAWHPERYGTLDGYVCDLIEVCDALELHGAVFVGHSISGSIGALASIRRPELFERLVMLGPSPRFLNDPESKPPYFGGFEREDVASLLELMDRNLVSWANFLAPIAMGNPERPELARDLATSFCAGDPTIARHFAETVFHSDVRDALPQVPVPALILQCADDAIAPREVGPYIHSRLPRSELRFMCATGHCPHLSHPEETIEMIRAYLDDHAPQDDLGGAADSEGSSAGTVR